MRKALFLSAILIVVFITGSGCTKKASITEQWATTDELRVPESVMYDRARDILYVSNINGQPTEKNNKGFISRVRLDGTIDELQWVTGFNAPKGMGIEGDLLYVTDIDRLHCIDIEKGDIIKTFTVEGAQFLNDIAIDEDGTVFFSDMQTNRIHYLKDDSDAIWLELAGYSNANGLFIENGNLLVGTAQGLLKISMADKGTALAIPHKGGIDGLKAAGKGAYIVSDWQGKTELISKDKEPVVLMDTSDRNINSADLEYIPGKGLILIPTFFNNRVVAYRLKLPTIF